MPISSRLYFLFLVKAFPFIICNHLFAVFFHLFVAEDLSREEKEGGGEVRVDAVLNYFDGLRG